MHHNEKAKQDAGVTKGQTVDTMALVRTAVEAVNGQREVEIETTDGETRTKVRVKAY